MERFEPGENVLLIHGDRRVPATVMIASPCGKSLMVGFDAIVAGHVTMMPLLYDGSGFVSVMTGEPVHLARIEG